MLFTYVGNSLTVSGDVTNAYNDIATYDYIVMKLKKSGKLVLDTEMTKTAGQGTTIEQELTGETGCKFGALQLSLGGKNVNVFIMYTPGNGRCVKAYTDAKNDVKAALPGINFEVLGDKHTDFSLANFISF